MNRALYCYTKVLSRYTLQIMVPTGLLNIECSDMFAYLPVNLPIIGVMATAYKVTNSYSPN